MTYLRLLGWALKLLLLRRSHVKVTLPPVVQAELDFGEMSMRIRRTQAA